MRTIAWFQLVVGAGILAIWPVLVAAGEVAELAAGQRDIWFHMAAEAIAGLLLVAAGWALLRSTAGWTRLLSSVALGALLYTAVNSSGYYADRGSWMAVAGLMLVAVAAAAAFAKLVRPPQPSRDALPAAQRELVG